MTASDHATKPLRNTLRERGHPYMTLGAREAGGLPMIRWPAGALRRYAAARRHESINDLVTGSGFERRER